MNVAAMRLVDKWSGVPACALLTVMRRIGDLFAPRRPVAEPKRIAAIKLAEQGATVVAYPALNLAAEKVGRENLFFVVFTQNRFIVDLLEIVPPENVIAIRTDNPFQTLWDTGRAVLRMRREKIDATVDCEFFARSTAILSFLSGASIRVGFHAFFGEASYRGDLMTHRIIFNATLHASEIFHFLFDAIWCDASQLPTCDLMRRKSGQLPNFEPAAETLASVDALLKSSSRSSKAPWFQTKRQG